jgi:uncharacterized protein (DUF58 family)
MLTPRGVATLVAGLAMWLAARIVGSAGLEIVGLGLAALPVVALAASRWRRRRLEVRRRLSDPRVAPGARVTVEVGIDNRSVAATPFMLIEDRMPSALGRPARLVLAELPGRTGGRVAYSVVPQARGRYPLGPLSVDVTDAFGMARQRLRFDLRDEVVVTPEIEDLASGVDPSTGPSFGAARARQLLRVGEEYFTMRQYQHGDDLRRLHWPSVARTGELMIRQDEATRRANGLVFLDQRRAAVGQVRGAAFERAVSAAASVGVLLLRAGFQLRLATSDMAPTALTEERFLDALAGVTDGNARTLAPSLAHLRAAASADTSLVFVSAPPPPAELASLIRAASSFGPKLAVLVHASEPSSLPPDRQAQLEGRATQARLALARAGWDCVILSPSTRLVERWHTPNASRDPRLASNA